MDDRHIHTPVLIVGGGPAGLALAVELGWRGVACTLIEQTDGTITTPKMNEVNTRTMEFCRRWGMAETVLNCPFPGDFPLDTAFITTLFGYELGRAPRAARNSAEPEPHSPYRLQACSQIWFDPMLQAKARTYRHVTLLHRHRLESFTQSEAGVTARMTDLEHDKTIEIAADYMVGCDGATSGVRRALGIELVGRDVLSNPLHMYFVAPNLLRDSGKHATFFFPIDAGGLWGSMRIIDPNRGLWRIMVDDMPGVTDPSQVDRPAVLRRALGRDYPVEWLGMSIWKRRSVVAERYGKGRVFLSGDAVHQLSPTGALGMNSGIGDSVDIGWKIAAVLDGWGGPHLLGTYDLERRPVGVRNVGTATGFYLTNESFGRGHTNLEDPGEAGRELRKQLGEGLEREVGREFRTIGSQIGYRYEGSPIIMPDGTPAPPDEAAVYVPSARPGSRAPHVWLGQDRTILDHFGEGFVLLRFGDDAPDGLALKHAAASRKVPFAIVPIASQEAAALYERKLALVRPDGHVAWRSDEMPKDAVAVIDRVRGAY
jgi:2-polyprenyl-6-methoxyphenol hydroxylase-like FAD-dependent oxidoreductase